MKALSTLFYSCKFLIVLTCCFQNVSYTMCFLTRRDRLAQAWKVVVCMCVLMWVGASGPTPEGISN